MLNMIKPLKLRSTGKVKVNHLKLKPKTHKPTRLVGLKTQSDARQIRNDNIGKLPGLSSKKVETDVYDLDDIDEFSKAEIGKILGIAAFIDITNSKSITEFGRDEQEATSKFADDIVAASKKSIIGPASDKIKGIVCRAKELDIANVMKEDTFASKIFSFISTKEERVTEFKNRFDSITVDFDSISDELKSIQTQLLDNVDLLSQMYRRNLTQFKDLKIHIKAGELKIKRANDDLIPEMVENIKKNNDPFLSSQLDDFKRAINRLDKKINDLKIVKLSALQTAPQLKIIQTNNEMIADKIDSTIHTIIPLWKKQFVMAISMLDQQKAVESDGEVHSAINKAMKDGADLSKMTAIECAEHFNKGPIDLETLQYVQERLVETINDTMRLEDNV